MSQETSREEKQRILRERAEAFASIKEADTFDYWGLEIVELEIHEKRYAFESSFIQEVLPLKNLTPLPCAPPFIHGIMNLRGRIISVMDLQVFFQLPEKGSVGKYLVHLATEEMEVGIAAHKILGSRHIPLYQVEAPPPTFTKISKAFLKGIVDGSLIILDGERFLAHKSLVVNEEAQ